ncbi:unnamed protein product [Hymenolepis diminuta]|uniref:Amino acid transporter n=1 Tax=Hymenolepis diminuta TaxID=6216 RepID=A0A0R3SN97_HYMDI|nr:unnamed protein product [Hymenolepis diminuta]VUZ40669.1 unnamed protein product [Hymenolepis diminuta]
MVAGSVLGREDIASDFIQLGLFIITVLVGLLTHLAIAILVLFIISGKNPFRILRFSVEPFLISFATTSPTVAMSEMYLGLDNYGTSKLTSRFVVPVCSALKGDGPAVFIASACVFVAQQMGVELDAAKIIFIM